MTKKDLERWLKGATWSMIGEYTVPSVAAGSRFGHELALKWIESKREATAAAGWTTLSLLVGTKDDAELDLDELQQLLQRVETTIHTQPNRVRYAMNGFVIALGAYVAPLSAHAVKAAKKIGKVQVDMGDTACKVPFAPEYIKKIQDRGTLGKKRKSAKC
jgi:hypothetical protein